MIYNRSLKDKYSKFNENDSNLIPFLLGRNAINYLIQTLEIKSVFLPSYICSMVIDIFKEYDIEVFFYENLNRSLEVPIEKIIATIESANPKNKLFFLWHDYLNIIGDLPSELSDFLKKSKIDIIIDATHSLPIKSYQSKNVVFGFRKLLNQPFGSLLKFSKHSSEDFNNVNKMKIWKFIFFHKISTSIFLLFKGYNNKTINFVLKGISKFGGRLSFDKNNFFLFEQFHYSKILGFHKNLDYESISKKRKENFLKYSSSFSDQINIDNFDISCPYGYPLLVKDNKRARRKLWDMGVHSFILWSDLHKDIPSKYSNETIYLSNSILILPVNQDLSLNDIKKIIEIING